jgi:hypothetical protein
MFSKEYLLLKKSVCLIGNQRIPTGCNKCVRIVNESDPDQEISFYFDKLTLTSLQLSFFEKMSGGVKFDDLIVKNQDFKKMNGYLHSFTVAKETEKNKKICRSNKIFNLFFEINTKAETALTLKQNRFPSLEGIAMA